jgi:transposase-like protein
MKDNSLNKTYSKAFKLNAVEQLLAANSGGLTATACKIGIPNSTLNVWKKKYGSESTMKNSNKKIDDWTPEQKLEAINKTYSMSENELGEYLRATGLYSSDLENFKSEVLNGFKSKGRPKLDPEVSELRKQNKRLERDLKNKDKALAEYSARVILLKKSHEIWGTPEDEE